MRNGNVIYISSPIFSQYNQNAPLWCKKLVLNALDLLLPEPLVRHDGPSSIFATLNEQAAENRQVLHLLHYIPERRGLDFDVIEDVIPLYDVAVSLRVEQPVAGVLLVPQGEAVDFAAEEWSSRFRGAKDRRASDGGDSVQYSNRSNDQ